MTDRLDNLASYVLCHGSGWGSAFPIISRVETKTAAEVAYENDMARQLQMERYWITLEYAHRRFPDNAMVSNAAFREANTRRP